MCCVLFVACLAASAQANLISNGSFEAQPVGTTVSSGSGNFTDSTTFTGWRVNNGNAASDFFTATIVPSTDRNAGAGTNALRLAITNNTDTACWVDQGGGNQPAPVSYGKTYFFSFDAAWVSGGSYDNLWIGIEEFDSSGTFIVRDQINIGYLSVVSTNFTTYSYTWTPTATNCARMCPIFYPEAGRTDPATVDLDNVVLTTVSTPDEAIAFGHFQGVPPGTSISQTTDVTTIPGWEVHDDNPGSDFFTATIITNNDPSDIVPGAHTLRLAITNNSDIACSLKSAVSIPASYGTTYFVSFDAARISGDDGTTNGNNMWVGVFEYDSSGNVLNRPGVVGGGNGFMSVTATNYTTFAYAWTPDQPSCASIRFIFYPEGTRNETVTIDLANIIFENSKNTPNLFSVSGGFNGVAQGTSVSNTIDSTTIPGWRFYDANPVDDFFSATIIPNTDTNDLPGTNAIELAISGNSDINCWFDQWNFSQQAPVSYGTPYVASFDAAWVSGDNFDNVWVGIWEFDSSGNYLQRDTAPGFLSVSAANYTTYSYTGMPLAPNCARMGFVFYPDITGGATTLDIANVVLTKPYANQMANVAVSASANPSGHDQPVTFTATVTGTGGTPAGSVVFSSPAGPFSTNSLSGGSATSLAITNLPAGTNLITVTYNDYLGGANTLNQIVKYVKFSGIVSGNPTTLTALGVPEYYYILERATNLASAVWVDVQTNQATISGVITASDYFSDLGNHAPKSAFYRLKWNGN